MEENKKLIENTITDQVNIDEDKPTSLSLRTKESIKNAFKEVEGNTDNEKLMKLLELHEEFQKTEDKFNVGTNLNVIDKSFNVIKSQINAIVTAINQFDREMDEKYTVNIACKMKELKDEIVNEDILKAKIIESDKEKEILNAQLREEQEKNDDYKSKIIELESENKTLVTKNSDLVHSENKMINQLREKDNEINLQNIEIDKLKSFHTTTVNNLEMEYKEKLKGVESDAKLREEKMTQKSEVEKKELKEEIERLKELNVQQWKTMSSEKEKIKAELESEITDLEKDKIVIETERTNLQKNLDVISKENEELKGKIDLTIKESKEELNQLRREHKEEVKSLEEEIRITEERVNKSNVEKAKSDSKIEILENNINTLQAEIDRLQAELKVNLDTINKKELEINRLTISLDNIKSENKELKQKK